MTLFKKTTPLTLFDLKDFAPGKQITVEVVHADGSKDTIRANHTYNDSKLNGLKKVLH